MSRTQRSVAAGNGPDVPAASLAAAMARAWEVRRLYGPDHDAARRTVQELAAATRGLGGEVTFRILEGGIAVGDRPLEPPAAFRGLADGLMSLNAVAITFLAPMEATAAAALIDLLGGGLDEGETDVESAIARVSNGAVRVRGVCAEGLRVRPGAGGESRAPLALADVVDRGGQVDEHAPFRALVARLAGGAEPTGQGTGGCAGPGGEWLGDAIEGLSPDARRKLLGALSAEGMIPYDRAVEALSRLPVTSVAQAIAVIGRSDAQLSETSLLLLRRYANLASDSRAELGRLGEVASSWSAPGVPDGPEKEKASATAALLRRLADTEYRSAEYSQLLRTLVDLPDDSPTEVRKRIEDDAAAAPQRVVQVLLDVLTDRSGLNADRAAALETLGPRMLAVAEAGSIDAVRAVLDAAGRIGASPESGAERDGAERLLKRAEQEQWAALSIGRCCNSGAVCERLKAVREQSPEEALRLLVQAAAHARSPAERQGMLECAALFEPGEVAAATERFFGARPAEMGRLCYLLAGLAGQDPIGRMRPMLLSADEGTQREALRSLARLGVEWPVDLCIRAMYDTDVSVRCIGVERLVRAHPERIDVLISRLVGQVGSRQVTDAERAMLVTLIQTHEGRPVTRRLSVAAVKAAFMPGEGAVLRALLGALRERPATLGSRVALGSVRGGEQRRAA